jgi:hypothetical protein
MTIRTYRKIPIELQAVQFTGDNLDEVRELTGGSKFSLADDLDREKYGDDEIAGMVWDHRRSTWVGVKAGQWIMKDTEGEHWPVDEAVLAKSYEAVA